jgi:tetratricopeptide (TPR) repeat protein
LFARAGFVLLLLLAASGADAGAGSPPDKGCSVGTFESQPAHAIAACTALLDAGGLSDRHRAEVLKIRARARHATGRLDEAIGDYETALRLAPDDPELHMRRGWTAYDKQDFALVLRQVDEAVRLKPGYAAALDLRGAVLAHQNVQRFAEARTAYDEAIRSEPDNPLFRYHLLQLTSNWMSPREGLKAADGLLELPAVAITREHDIDYYGQKTTYRTAALLERARMLVRLGRRDEAQATYDRAIADDPGALTYAWRAAFRINGANVDAPMDEAQADIDRSFAADPNYWFSLGLAGRVQFYSKHYEAAAAAFARAVDLYPTNGTMRWWHARALRKLGRSEDAATEAVSAFRVDPGFMYDKADALRQHGFLVLPAADTDPRPAFYDAARACMLDDQCR